MSKWLVIAGGGAVGAVLRYAATGAVHRMLPGDFPWGTMAVNLLGSLIMGLLWGASEVVALSPHIRLCLLTGVLGAFTTFSTFSLENVQLLHDGEYGMAMLNMTLSVGLGIVCVLSGLAMARSLFPLTR